MSQDHYSGRCCLSLSQYSELPQARCPRSAGLVDAGAGARRWGRSAVPAGVPAAGPMLVLLAPELFRWACTSRSPDWVWHFSAHEGFRTPSFWQAHFSLGALRLSGCTMVFNNKTSSISLRS